MEMVNFICKFIPNQSAKISCIRELLHKENEFKWTTKHENEWKKLEQTLTTALQLNIEDQSVYRCLKGWNWSSTLTGWRWTLETSGLRIQVHERDWALICSNRKRAPRISVWLPEIPELHNVYDLPSFTIETDHRPLVSIIRNNLNEMSPRIQRLMMKMQRYDFELVYTAGKHLIIAEALSWAPKGNNVCTTEEDVQSHVNMVLAALPVSDTKSRQIADETARDTDLQCVIENMNNGWPVGSCPLFYHIRGELSVVNGLLLKQNRIVIPLKLRKETSGHQVISVLRQSFGLEVIKTLRDW